MATSKIIPFPSNPNTDVPVAPTKRRRAGRTTLTPQQEQKLRKAFASLPEKLQQAYCLRIQSDLLFQECGRTPPRGPGKV